MGSLMMDLQQLVRHLRNDLEEKVSLLAGLLKDLNTSKQDVELIERSCSSLIREQGDTLHCRDTEIQKLQEKIRDLQASLEKLGMSREDLQQDLTASQLEVEMKQRKIEELAKDMAGLKKRVQFKTNLEKSFESLQQKYQVKTDELEKLKRIGSLSDLCQVEMAIQKPAFKLKVI